jgi:NitT/TauT family transport system substrate-binding protein
VLGRFRQLSHGRGQGATDLLDLLVARGVNDALRQRLDFLALVLVDGPGAREGVSARHSAAMRAGIALNSMPLYLNTINPNVKSIRDFSDKDRIALPAVKISIQAITLQMAAEKTFGPGQHGKLDH